MLSWYGTLPVSQQIFSGMAMGFGGILALMLIASLAGGDADVDADIDVGGGAGAFSAKGILAFLTFFGLGGWVMLRAGSPVWLASVVGLGAGYAVMSVLAVLLARLRGLDADGGRRGDLMLRQEGDVYLTVPSSGRGVGRVQVRQGARLVEVEAVTKGPSIPSGSRARVVEVLGPGRVRVEAVRRIELGGSTADLVE